MKCPICAAWTEVLDTRAGKHEATRRRRRCGNGHIFPTVEVLPVMVNKVHQAASVRSMERRRALWRRDQAIRADTRHADDVADGYGITGDQVRRIRRGVRR